MSDRKVMLSIIIPEFDSNGLVHDAIESAMRVLERIDGDGEIIIVLDGPNVPFSFDRYDPSLFSKNLIRVFRLPVNSGGAYARNVGIHEANGEYIQFLDSDDLLIADGVIAKLDLSRKSDKRVIYYGVSNSYDFNSYKQGYKSPAEDVESVGSVEKYFRHNIQTSLPIYRTSVLLEIGGFNPSLRFGQEFEMNVRLLLQGFYFLNTFAITATIRQGHIGAMGGALHKKKYPLAKINFLLRLCEITEKSSYKLRVFLFLDLYNEILYLNKIKSTMYGELAKFLALRTMDYKSIFGGGLKVFIKYLELRFFPLRCAGILKHFIDKLNLQRHA